MKKTFRLEDLDCANCAAKMEDSIRKIDGVSAVSINFVTQKMALDAVDDQFDAILKQAVKICKRIEPDCRVIL